MTNAQALYGHKRMTAADAVGLIRDGDTVVVPTGVGEPPALLEALSERRHALRDVAVSQILPLRKFAYLDPETRAHIRHDAYFFGGTTRPGGQAGWVDYLPAYFSELPMLIDRGLTPVDVVVSMASPMDEHGYFSLSLAPDYTMAALRRARVILLEVNPNVPFAFGDCHVHISQVTGVVERDDALFEVGLPAIGPVQEAIGKYVADMIEDGSTLQIGYGGIPDAVVMQLQHKHDLGIHTEMIGDGILSLIECGAVTNRRKTFMPGKTVATFALGSNRLYRFLDRNPALEMHPVDFTNDPYVAARNDKLCAINATLQIDLLGQCGSESLGHRRPGGFRARGQPFEGRQGLHRAAFDSEERQRIAHRTGAVARNARDNEQERHQFRRHRVRRRRTARQERQTARKRADRHRASGFPRRTA